jgi:predicted nucleotidyltransferase
MSQPDLGQLRQVVSAVAESLSLRLAVLFGSTARGASRPEDLDIGVLADRPVDTVALTNELTRSLGRQDVDLTDLRVANPVLLALLAREGVPLYEREPGEFSRFASLAVRRFADTRKFREAEAGRLSELALRRAIRP